MLRRNFGILFSVSILIAVASPWFSQESPRALDSPQASREASTEIRASQAPGGTILKFAAALENSAPSLEQLKGQDRGLPKVSFARVATARRLLQGNYAYSRDPDLMRRLVASYVVGLDFAGENELAELLNSPEALVHGLKEILNTVPVESFEERTALLSILSRADLEPRITVEIEDILLKEAQKPSRADIESEKNRDFVTHTVTRYFHLVDDPSKRLAFVQSVMASHPDSAIRTSLEPMRAHLESLQLRRKPASPF